MLSASFNNSDISRIRFYSTHNDPYIRERPETRTNRAAKLHEKKVNVSHRSGPPVDCTVVRNGYQKAQR